MNNCWKLEPNKRPTMDEIVDTLIENSEKYSTKYKVSNLTIDE